MHRYWIHGLTLHSEFPLPHAAPDAGASAAPDIQVRQAKLPEPGDAVRVGDWLRGTTQALRLRIPGVGEFACLAGREIRVAPHPGASPARLELFTLGIALAIVLYQRGDFPLHGAFVADGDRAYGFCGARGEGKSTVGLAVARTGRDLLADDVAVVRSDSGEPRVYAENTHMKLWEDAIRHFSLPVDANERVDEAQPKYYVPLRTRIPSAPPRLEALVMLESAPPASEPRLEPLRDFPALVALREHTYRPFLIGALGLDRQHLEFGAALLKRVRMYRFRRPRALERLRDGAELLMRALTGAPG